MGSLSACRPIILYSDAVYPRVPKSYPVLGFPKPKLFQRLPNALEHAVGISYLGTIVGEISKSLRSILVKALKILYLLSGSTDKKKIKYKSTSQNKTKTGPKVGESSPPNVP